MNEIIRRTAKASGVSFWKICDELGISEPTFTRLLRKPLSEEKQTDILNIIKRISGLQEAK
jgi:hypothetical protein